MKQAPTFQILERVDSTNNYAMAALHAGLAKPGNAWFAREQTAGRGQRGKPWFSAPGENIMMSILVKPPAVFSARPFLFNMLIAVAAWEILSKYAKSEIKVKWPNDLYLGDRKAGGLLIENIYRGRVWNWSVVGIGINVNQVVFPEGLGNATSLKLESGESYDSIGIAQELHLHLLDTMAESNAEFIGGICTRYNSALYLLNRKVRLRRQNIVFQTLIKGVSEQGRLQTFDTIAREFSTGEVEWLL